MKQLILSLSVVGLLLLLSSNCSADPQHQHMSKFQGSRALELIKSLQGDWQGVVNGPEGEEKTEVSYRITSNGSAVVETLFKGTPMEMTSVYYDKRGKLMMTHYCAIGNRPTMSLVDEDAHSITMDYHSGEELDPEKDMHIHGLHLTLNKDGSLLQKWKGFEMGKQTHETVLKLSKVNK